MFSFNMDAAKADVARDLSPFIILYKDGRIERLIGNEIAPPSDDPKSNVQSKDVKVPFSPTYHNYVNLLVAEAKVIAISVDYRRVPEHPIPVPYDDSWAALNWAASHVNGDGPEEWLNKHADFSRGFFGW
ncbi:CARBOXYLESTERASE 2-RELATED [Salix viminalis]|uniref:CARBOXYLESTERASE 2-RELATED n=1 Tax=Salix viminalis TaxID=40686 RepID=A0A9Q0NK06_SALVM|nr:CARBOXYLESTERASE 2-RELATED [Salix viminalis]